MQVYQFLICQENERDSIQIPVNLPPKMVRNIVSFLEKNHPKSKWYCHHFVAAACGIPFDIKSREHVSSWFYTAYRCDGFSPGDIVALFDGVHTYKHYAVYLSNNLFLSKFDGGMLAITTADEMHRVYSTKTLVLLRPMTSEIKQLMRKQGWNIERDGVFREPAPSVAVDTPYSSLGHFEEPVIERYFDLMVNLQPPTPAREIIKELNSTRKAAKLIKKHGFWSGSLAAAGIRVGATVGSRFGPLGKMAGAEMGRRVLQPVGEVLDEATRRQAEIETKMIEAGVAPIPFGHH